MTAGFGLFGYALIKFGFEPAPLLLGFVLGKLMEEKLRQALVISRGSFMTFVERPLSGGLLALALVLVVIAVLPSIRKSRDEVFVGGGLRRRARGRPWRGIRRPPRTSPSIVRVHDPVGLPRPACRVVCHRCAAAAAGAPDCPFLAGASRGIPAGSRRRGSVRRRRKR